MSGGAGVLADLDEQQRIAVQTVPGPLAILAGAGSGKTRVITHRIAHAVDVGAYTPQRVLALTFTTKAAGEMRARLRGLGVPGVAARTFHAAALAQLNYFWPIVAGGQSAPRVLGSKAEALADAALRLRLRLDRAAQRDVAAEIEWRKVRMLTVEEYIAQRPEGAAGFAQQQLADLHEAYELAKDARGQIDFEDILLACAGMIEQEPRVAAQIQEQYRHFTVDEYQDVSPVQRRLLRLWLGSRDDVCVVGDSSQTIYSFAGAEPRYLLEFEHDFPGARVIRLERNYRSSQPVLDAANRLMADAPGALVLRAARPDGAAGPDVRVRGFDSDEDEAAAVAADIGAQVTAGVEPSEIAVLYRTQVQSMLIQAALRDADVPSRVLGQKAFFDRAEVREALLMIRGEAVARGGSPAAPAVRDVLRGLGLTDSPPTGGGALRDAWDARSAIMTLAERAGAETTLRSFADELQRRAQDQDEPRVRAVTLATLHAAKGLEWDLVYLVGLTEGNLPIWHAQTDEQIAEERRLLYVGITRARRRLTLSWSATSARGAASRFLAAIGRRTPDVADASAASRSARSG